MTETTIAPDNQSMGLCPSMIAEIRKGKIMSRINGRDYHTKTISYRFNEMQFLIVRSTGAPLHTHTHTHTVHAYMPQGIHKYIHAHRVKRRHLRKSDEIHCMYLFIKSSPADASDADRRRSVYL